MREDREMWAARSTVMTSGEIFAVCKTYTPRGPSYGIMIKDEYDVSVACNLSDNLDEVIELLRMTAISSCSAIHLGSVIDDWKTERQEEKEKDSQMPPPVCTSFSRELFGRRISSVIKNIRKRLGKFSRKM